MILTKQQLQDDNKRLGERAWELSIRLDEAKKTYGEIISDLKKQLRLKDKRILRLAKQADKPPPPKEVEK